MDKKSNLITNTYPNLVKEWFFERNSDIDINTITTGSNKKVWWKCQEGHYWQATVHNRYLGGGCPYCKNRKIWIGFNDLATTHPQLADEWDYENNIVSPQEITYGSSKIIHWICKNGHKWKGRLNDRQNHDCPICANKKVLTGYNDLSTTHPQLAAQWNYNLNKNLRPTDVIAGSDKKVWWQCMNGHDWMATLHDRKKGTGCPYCAGKKKCVA